MSAELNIQLDQVNDRIEAGMAWLDANIPDWWLDVNAHALDINDSNWCVLGQLARSDVLAGRLSDHVHRFALGGFGGYVRVTSLFGLGWDQPRDLGFLGTDLLTGEDYVMYTAALEARWFVVILARQKERLLPGMSRAGLASHVHATA